MTQECALRRQLAALEVITGLTGLGLIVWQVGWWAAFGVLLCLWSSNFKQAEIRLRNRR